MKAIAVISGLVLGLGALTACEPPDQSAPPITHKTDDTSKKLAEVPWNAPRGIQYQDIPGSDEWLTFKDDQPMVDSPIIKGTPRPDLVKYDKDARCSIAKAGVNEPPAINDGGHNPGLYQLIKPYHPTGSAIECAVARLSAAGYSVFSDDGTTVMGMNSNGRGLLDAYLKPTWGCFVELAITDYQGNYVRSYEFTPDNTRTPAYNFTPQEAVQLANSPAVLSPDCVK